MVITALYRHGITLKRPATAIYGESSVRLGALAFALLRAVGNSTTGSVPIVSVKSKVWNDKRLDNDRVRVLCNRLNAKLESIGCPASVGLDRGRVALKDWSVSNGPNPRPKVLAGSGT